MSGRSSGYQVGYGKPPRHTRFRKGRSGNPKGRAKGLTTLAQIATRIFNERVVIRENGQRRSITKLEAALKQLANKAAGGDKRAIEAMIRFQATLCPNAPIRGAETANPELRAAETDQDRARAHGALQRREAEGPNRLTFPGGIVNLTESR